MESYPQIRRSISGDTRSQDSSLYIPFIRSDGTIESVPQYPEDAYYANAIPNRMSLSNRHRSQPVVSFNCKHSVSTPSNHYPRDVSMFYPTTPVPSSDIGTQGPIASSGNSFSRTKQSPSSRNPLFPRGQLPPGEFNPDAYLGAKLCFEFMNKGVSAMPVRITRSCERQRNGSVCHFRHLSPNHPEAIADRFQSGLLSEEEIAYYKLRPCEPFETNPFAPKDAKICFEFLNKHVCSRNAKMQVCHFRHLLPNHPDAIADRERSKAMHRLD
ncbi:hypothetical protein BLSTO_02894 [Blastocystis sp. subtype 1]